MATSRAAPRPRRPSCATGSGASAKRFLRVRGRRVVGRGDALIEVARQHGAKAVILAITKAEPALLQEVADQCQVAGLEFVVVPPVRELIGGRVELEQLRAFNIADLLGRDTVQTDLSAIAGLVSGQVVLVTGAGGSTAGEPAAGVDGG